MVNDELKSFLEHHNLKKVCLSESPTIGILRYVRLLKNIKGYREKGIVDEVDITGIELDILNEIEILVQQI